MLLIANLFSLVAGVTFVVRLFSVDHALRRAARLPLMVTGMVTGSLVALLGAGSVLPGEPEAWNLASWHYPNYARHRSGIAVYGAVDRSGSDVTQERGMRLGCEP